MNLFQPKLEIPVGCHGTPATSHLFGRAGLWQHK